MDFWIYLGQFWPWKYLPRLDSSGSIKNTVGKALTLWALVFNTALHSSWICTKSMEDNEADLVKGFGDVLGLFRISSGLGVRAWGCPCLLGVLLLLGRTAMRCLAAAWFKSARVSGNRDSVSLSIGKRFSRSQ